MVGCGNKFHRRGGAGLHRLTGRFYRDTAGAGVYPAPIGVIGWGGHKKGVPLLLLPRWRRDRQ